MSSSPEADTVNGHISPVSEDDTMHVATGDQSDSDLSDVQAADADVPSPASADGFDPSDKPDLTLEEPSDASNDDASDDADFDMADSPASARSNAADNNRATSSEPRPVAKRKAVHAIEEEYMRENPELYGLRRSVRA